MGGLVSSVGSNLKQAQSEMMEEQMKRQLAMQNEMRLRQMAMQIGIARERLFYYQIFYFAALFGCTLGAIKMKKPQICAPLVPLSCAYAFQYDMAWGLPDVFAKTPLMIAARNHAENIMNNEAEKYLALPNGMPSIDDIINKAK